MFAIILNFEMHLLAYEKSSSVFIINLLWNINLNQMENYTIWSSNRIVIFLQLMVSKPYLEERFTDLGKLNYPMVVRFKAGANFQHCPSCLQQYRSIQKWSKLTQKSSSRFVNLNPWHNLQQTIVRLFRKLTKIWET